MINQFFNRQLSNPIYFRYIFFILLIFSITLNTSIFYDKDHFYILYIFSAISLGIGFYNKSIWFLTLFTLILVTCRYFLIPDSDPSISIFFIHFITYFIITIISSGLMKYAQKVKEDNLELTMALAQALDSRDSYTMHHSKNVAKFSVQVAKKMGLSKESCEIIYKGALLHDIGKIGIPCILQEKSAENCNEKCRVLPPDICSTFSTMHWLNGSSDPYRK